MSRDNIVKRTVRFIEWSIVASLALGIFVIMPLVSWLVLGHNLNNATVLFPVLLIGVTLASFILFLLVMLHEYAHNRED